MATRRTKAARTYFGWLCGLVDIGTGLSDHNHKELVELLHNKRFYWSVPNDDNREEDAKELRELFLSEHDYISSRDLNEQYSVFEIMLSLSIRMEYILSDDSIGDQMPKRFWEMIDNLDLSCYLCDGCQEDEINDIIDRFLQRGYERNGNGGLFPLKNPREDQRKVEIWYQMMAYINENYAI